MYSKYCFSLVMYEFCSNNSLYSVSIPFTIFVIPFDTIGCYQISYKAGIAYYSAFLQKSIQYCFVVVNSFSLFSGTDVFRLKYCHLISFLQSNHGVSISLPCWVKMSIQSFNISAHSGFRILR